jgi:hypothetical protein
MPHQAERYTALLHRPTFGLELIVERLWIVIAQRSVQLGLSGEGTGVARSDRAPGRGLGAVAPFPTG